MYLLLIGIIFVIGGLSGGLALRGTGSSEALAVVGGIMCLIGIIQLVRAKPEEPRRRVVRGRPGAGRGRPAVGAGTSGTNRTTRSMPGAVRPVSRTAPPRR